MKKLLLLSLIIVSLSGCTIMGSASNRGMNALSVVTTSAELYFQYENGSVVNFLDQAELTELELVSIMEALDQAERSRGVLKRYKSRPEQLLVDINTVAFQYAKIKSSYLSIRSIVGTHWSEYTDEAKQSYLIFDEYAQKLDIEFSSLMTSIKSDAALTTALNLANLTLKIAAVM